MRNFVQSGLVVPIIAPAGGVTSGAGVLVGSLFGVANGDAAEGAEAEISTAGVFELAKADGVTFTQGAPAYFDSAAGTITTVSTGNVLVGVVLIGAGSSDPTAAVRLNGVFGAASAADVAALDARVTTLEP